MEKLKHIKKNLKDVKCFMKRILMSRSSNEPSQRASLKRKRAYRKPSTSTVPGASSSAAEEGFIPLAARDSQWVGLQFYNPHFRSPLDEEDDAEEVELQNLAADGIEAIYLLFPGLAKVKTNNNLSLKEHDSSSTTEITKLLVGQKADFRNMKSSKKAILTDSKLGTVHEKPQEEKQQNESDISITTIKKSLTAIASDTTGADDEEDEPTKLKRTKTFRKKSEARMLQQVRSSTSFIPKSKKSQTSMMNVKKSSESSSPKTSEKKANEKQKQQS